MNKELRVCGRKYIIFKFEIKDAFEGRKMRIRYLMYFFKIKFIKD